MKISYIPFSELFLSFLSGNLKGLIAFQNIFILSNLFSVLVSASTLFVFYAFIPVSFPLLLYYLSRWVLFVLMQTKGIGLHSFLYQNSKEFIAFQNQSSVIKMKIISWQGFVFMINRFIPILVPALSLFSVYRWVWYIMSISNWR